MSGSEYLHNRCDDKKCADHWKIDYVVVYASDSFSRTQEGGIGLHGFHLKTWAAHLTYRTTWLSQSVHKVYDKFLGKSSSICWFSFTKLCLKSMLSYAKQAKSLNSLADWCGEIDEVFTMASFNFHCFVKCLLNFVLLPLNFYLALFRRKFDPLICTF